MVEFYSRLAAFFGGLPLAAQISLIVGLTLATTAAGFALILLLPSNHFVKGDGWMDGDGWQRYRVVAYAVLVLRNLLGLMLLPLGIVMALPLVPGPGLLFILLGLSLVSFPGKRALERRLLCSPRISRFLNDLRARFGRPPFELG